MPSETQHHFLEPGNIYCAVRPTTLHAVLGHGVGVCLWDRRRRIGTMAHFAHPVTRDAAKATPRYGNAATWGAIRLMEEAGAHPATIIAHIIGGAALDHVDDVALGMRNVAAARGVLERAGITIHAEDTGGAMGRKVAFDTGTGHIIVLKVHRLRLEDWAYDRSA
jgi:chemotaxis protein CheD